MAMTFPQAGARETAVIESVDATGQCAPAVDSRSPSDRKVALFRSLFRGREDVYARRFESRKSGRSGYQPDCANEWVRGVCEKPRIAPHVQAIKDSLAKITGIPGNRIGIKATTTDGMGFTGRGEGIASYAVALIKPAPA